MDQDGRENISGQSGGAGMETEGRSGQRRVGEVLAEVGDDIATEARALRDAAGETVASEADGSGTRRSGRWMRSRNRCVRPADRSRASGWASSPTC